MAKIKFKSDIFKSFNKFSFYNFFISFLLSLFFSYIYKYLKIYQLIIIKKIKKDYIKKLVKDVEIFLKKKKKKATIWL